MDILLILSVLFPILSGAAIWLFRFQNRRIREVYVLTTTILSSVIVVVSLFVIPSNENFEIFSITENLPITLAVDGMSRIFAGLVAVLWPLAVSYALEYMRHEGSENTFYTFYLMTYGITLGVAFAENLITLYLFYEFITLVTLPIVMHGMKDKNVKAGRKYVKYSIGGAAFAFVAMMVAYAYGGTTDFAYGGMFTMAEDSEIISIIRFVYLMAFFGFGVKAAVFPLYGWLPSASVAPTPVTALLHAVAVVNCGAFAILRVTYFVFGTEVLKGSWAQTICVCFTLFTILFGSTMALKEQHFKRRLAYSTISNLSYMLFGCSLMCAEGLTGALSHFVFHGVIKITLFFVAGIVLVKYEKAYINDLFGYGKKMKVTFICFTIASLALMGVPPTIGFTSKWYLLTGASKVNNWMGYAGMAVILISALLTAIYLMSVIIKVYFPGPAFKAENVAGVTDPGMFMKAPLIILCVIIIVLGIFSSPVISYIQSVAGGLV